jgi:hypothetical protein
LADRAWKLVTRVGPKVEREKFADLGSALDAMQARVRELERTTHAEPVNTMLGRRFDPVQQVAARLELRGPGWLRGGVDVRGDGSSEAFIGWLRRRLVVQQAGESAYDALRRELRG